MMRIIELCREVRFRFRFCAVNSSSVNSVSASSSAVTCRAGGISIALISLLSAAGIVSCVEREDISVMESPGESAPSGMAFTEELTIDFGNGLTKTTFSHDSGSLRSGWMDGDKVFISPACYSSYGLTYVVPAGGAGTNTFVLSSGSIKASSKNHLAYYPGDRIKNDQQFLNFSYTGQVQRKSDPMGHMGDFHSMRQLISYSSASVDYDVNHISFQGCIQSGCTKFILSGVQFQNPDRIELSVYSGGVRQSVFSETNRLSTAYPDEGQSISWPNTYTGSLSLGLEGYGSESQLVAYLMHSCSDVQLSAGDVLRVTVYGDTSYYADVPVTVNTAIKGGYCSYLSVSEGWKILEGDFTEYSWDGEVVTMQYNGANALDVVIMGDGYIKEDFDNGTYAQTMQKVFNALFSVEPYTSLKNCFNVYYVKTPSPQRLNVTNTGANGGINGDAITKFNVRFTENSTNLSGDNALARAYARAAFTTDADRRMKDATVVVIANHRCHAGTCWSTWSLSNPYDYGQSGAVAYCALEANDSKFEQVVHHEVNGHGIGKLGDEYTSSQYYPQISGFQQEWNTLSERHAIGIYRNIDKYVSSRFRSYVSGSPATDTPDSDVLWYDLMNTSNHYEYASVESLGIFDGANVFAFGFCRPTQASNRSIMYGNSGIFNAISRRQILYRVRYITGQVSSNIWGTATELQYFLNWDAANVIPKIKQSSVPAMLSLENYSEEQLMPYAPVQFEEGEWVDGEFVPIQTSDRRYVENRQRYR